MTTEIAPKRIPEDKIQIDHANKRLALNAGLSIMVMRHCSENQIAFQVRMNFEGGREIILFERISMEIQDDWKNHEKIREAVKEILDGNEEHVLFIEEFILSSLLIRVEVEADGGLHFILSFHACANKQHFCDYSTNTKKHRNDVFGWLVNKKEKE